MPSRKLILFVFLLFIALSNTRGWTNDDETEDEVNDSNDALIEVNPDYVDPTAAATDTSKKKGRRAVGSTVSAGDKKKKKKKGPRHQKPVSSTLLGNKKEEGLDTQDSDTADGEEYDSDSDGGASSSSEEEEEEETEEAKQKTKSKLASALAKSRKSKPISTTLKAIKRHRTKITIALVLFAFRREISSFIYYVISTPDGVEEEVLDPQSGKVVIKQHRRVHVSPTSILKIFLFVDLMRRILSPDEGAGEGEETLKTLSLLSVLAGGGRSGILGHLLSGLLHSSNPTYVPPVEQHYTFERINERYEKDGMALQKAMRSSSSSSRRLGWTDMGLAASTSSSPTKSTTGNGGGGGVFGRTRFGLRRESGTNETATMRNVTNVSSGEGRFGLLSGSQSSSTTRNGFNGTVIIMELHSWTSSDAQIETLRDEVSFLISQHRARYKKNGMKNKTNQTGPEQVPNRTMATTGSLVPPGGGASINYLTDQTSNNVSSTEHTTDGANQEDELEVIILLESPGGSASDFGLASQQIGRLRNEPGIQVTVCVDKVAASGGYMMACMSSPSRLFAAPFAVVGSIGVIGQTLNIHNTLQNWGMKPLVFRGGKDKAPVGPIGEVTKEGIAKIQDMVDKTHRAFKRHVVEARPAVAHNIDEVATGDIFLGYDALDVGLIDRVITSDEYIGERLREGARVLKLVKYTKSKFPFGPPSTSRGYVTPYGRASVSHFAVMLMYDFRRVLSKLEDFLDELPRRGEDLFRGASARALGVTNIRATKSGGEAWTSTSFQ